MKRAVDGQRALEQGLRAAVLPDGTSKPLGERKVLVVDDEAAICDLLSLYLGWKGLEVKTAKTPAEAVLRVSETQFDLVILDWDLDGIEALDLLNFFKGTRPQMSVIIYTAQPVDEAFLKMALEGRADAILRKLGSLDIFWDEVSRQLTKPQDRNDESSGIGQV